MLKEQDVFSFELYGKSQEKYIIKLVVKVPGPTAVKTWIDNVRREKTQSKNSLMPFSSKTIFILKTLKINVT